MRTSRVLAAVYVVSICSLGTPARAQDIAAAKTMFDQGLADMEAGHFDKGCPALEASHKLDPRPGTVFTLAECEAKRGRLATAVARYDDYLSMYARLTSEQQRKQGTREKMARDQKAALGPQVPVLTLTLPPDAPGETAVRRDGTDLAAAVLGVALPVDPGEHRVTTQAPGGEVTEFRVTLGKGEKKQVTLQVKAAPPAAASRPSDVSGVTPRASPDTAPEMRSRVPALVMGVGALAAAGVGVGLFVASQGKRTDMLDLDKTISKSGGSCVGATIDQRCTGLTDTAHQSDTFHNIAIGAFVGASVLVAGTLTYLLLPPLKTKKTVVKSGNLQATPFLDAGQGGMVVSGAF